jgi:NAD(P)-dependent dehydrogenase (short-subunit alcohol dehydrogenase family)
MKLQEKTIILTGGSLGIGKAVAMMSAAEGARLILVARNFQALEETRKEIVALGHLEPFLHTLDVSDLQAVKAFAQWCAKLGQPVNGLVNCAGIYGPIGKTTDVSLEDFRKTMEINFLGAVYMCSLIGPLLRAEGRKKIVNFSGGGAAGPFPHYSAYATSKIAIVRYTENISIELAAQDIDVNCVAPGFVLTRMHQETLKAGRDAAGPSFYENTAKQLEKGGVPAEKAAALTVFLLSSESDGITGKFLSAPWDPWQTDDFRRALRSDKDFCTLRRIDHKTFFSKAVSG